MNQNDGFIPKPKLAWGIFYTHSAVPPSGKAPINHRSSNESDKGKQPGTFNKNK
ncbi:MULTISPECIES: hypothetical protein [Serratia]|uniref:hypothetical protein n=1 Tax=Serratia TaxID=613 RepID=UPI0013052478|nr:MULTISPECIES: hypothetical protein [Serratia]MBJ7893533.1 hypothetical protein [Serratia sp. PAMC26656]UTN96988.1 hypothetical protein NLX81_01390 [Serratia plymuthica]